MKKIACSVLSLLCAFNITASAEPKVIIEDFEKNRLAVCGEAPENSDVMIYILNSGYTKDDLVSGKDEALIYSSHEIADKNGYRFEFDMSDNFGGDDFKAIVAHSGTNETKSFSFYSDNIRRSFVESLSNKECAGEDIAEAIKTFGIQSDIEPDADCCLRAALFMEDIRKSDGYPKKEDGSYDTKKFSDILEKSIVYAALVTGSDNVFGSDGRLRFSDVFGITELDTYADYSDNISAGGVEAVKKYLQSASYDNGEAVSDVFCEAVYINVLTNYHMMGYGHVKEYIRKYETEYKSFGFDTYAFSTLGDEQKKTVCKAVSSSGAISLSELARVFNDAVYDASYTGGSSGSGGGSPSMGGSVAPGYIEPSVPPVQSGQQGSAAFTDVNETHWAYEYIKSMAEKNVINGYSDGSFRPDSGVTRAEFVKMTVAVFGLETDGGDSVFEDTKLSWCAPYVSAAVKAGFVTGITETFFGPDEPLTREQAVTIFARALSLSEAKAEEAFDDDSLIREYARGYVYAMRKEGIINGRDGNLFAPNAGITRAEAVKLMATALEF